MFLQSPLKTRGSLLVVFLIVFTLVPSQRSSAQETQSEDVLKVTTDLLLFPIRVKDKQGRLPTTLTEQDLALKDVDHVTTGVYLSAGADRVALMFALDQSGSLRNLISQQRTAAIALFDRFSERSSVAVLRFSASAKLIVPFSRDTAAARAAFEFREQSNQPTAIFDAAAMAIDAFRRLPRVRAERRILILISDGLDNASRMKASTIINAANAEHVSLYVIHLPLYTPIDGRLGVRPPSKGFRDLAENTGGKYFLAGNPRGALSSSTNVDLSPIFEAIEQDLKSQYLLGFYLGETANDGRKHRFSLSLPDGLEYQVGRLKYSRTHEFFVDRPREALKPPR